MTREVIEALSERKKSYQALFGGAVEHETLALLDLMKFCRANETCGVAPRGEPIDVNRTMVLIGRNEVWLRIWQHLNLTPEELAELYGAVAPTKDTDNG